MLKKIILGNRYLQKFFWKLLKLSVKGLNYDRGHVPSANGEVFSIEFAMQFFSDPAVIFDIGANRGQYLEMLIERVGKKKANVYCFEPQKSAYETLLKVVSGIKNENLSINTYNLGLSNSEGEVLIYSDSKASELASLYNANYIQLGRTLSNAEKISTTTLDNFCIKSGIENIDYLKIDVEGHELEVLRGAKSLLEQTKIKFIQFEFGLASIESRIFMKDFILLLSDFKIYRILPNGLSKIEYSEYCELFLTTNYLAIHNDLNITI